MSNRSGGKPSRDLSDAILLTRKDLTRVLRAGLTKIDEWIKDKKLHVFQVDPRGTVYCTRDDVLDFVNRYRSGQSNGLGCEGGAQDG